MHMQNKQTFSCPSSTKKVQTSVALYFFLLPAGPTRFAHLICWPLWGCRVFLLALRGTWVDWLDSESVWISKRLKSSLPFSDTDCTSGESGGGVGIGDVGWDRPMGGVVAMTGDDGVLETGLRPGSNVTCRLTCDMVDIAL